ncbi:MAG TPA: cupredoxin domain-containing protein [Candidatus Saccharimonadales bacterium]
MDEHRATVYIGNTKQARRWRPSKRTLISMAAAAVLVIGSVLALIMTRKDSVLPPSVATVEITETGFNPLVIKVKKGDRIQWVNKDSRLHQPAADPHPTSSSLPSLKSNEAILKDETYTAVFEKSGTFTYHDFLDPLNYQATIIVE